MVKKTDRDVRIQIKKNIDTATTRKQANDAAPKRPQVHEGHGTRPPPKLGDKKK